MREKVLAVLAQYAEGGTLKAALKAQRVHNKDFYTLLRDDADVRQKYDFIKEYRGDIYEDEIYETATDKRADPRRARVKIDGLRTLAGFANPARYGTQRVEVTGQIDLTAALTDAQRSLLRPGCDLDAIPYTDCTDISTRSPRSLPDKQSVELPKLAESPALDPFE